MKRHQQLLRCIQTGVYLGQLKAWTYKFLSRLNISLVQIASLLEWLGLVVAQLSPHWDLAPVRGSVSPTSALYLTQAHIITVKSGEVHAGARRGQRSRPAHYKLNTAHLGGSKRRDGVMETPPSPHNVKTLTAGSSVKGHGIAQTTDPIGSRCWCNSREEGGGGWEFRALGGLSFFSLRLLSQYFQLNDGDNLNQPLSRS